MKVLIIDDHEAVRQSLRATLREADWDVVDQGFADVDQTLASFRPDAVVLDLVEGDVTEPAAGNRSFEQIRSNWFCPVVVYSGYADQRTFGHPLVETVPKGRNADAQVVRCLEGFAEVVQVIRDVHREFDSRIREALRDSVPLLRDQITAPAAAGDEAVLPRAVRRLVAARMDAGASGTGLVKAWERFVVPALGRHLLSADLLRRSDADWTNPEAFRLVLTPSCDLVPHGGAEPRADQILVARCEPITRLGNVDVNPGTQLPPRSRNRLRSILTEGIADGLLPIPRFIGHVPSMAANLKRLELVEWTDVQMEVGGDGAPDADAVFVRVASTDSPFRELVVWAYLRVTGRPGAPDFDVDAWLDDLERG
ncbi:MAG: hypothetical protein OXG42_08190 [Chloroflexi bacterium]|nr:hypothetical protein [Chloroflexota bacterium]